MATGSFMTPIYSRSQSEVQGDLHNHSSQLKRLYGGGQSLLITRFERPQINFSQSMGLIITPVRKKFSPALLQKHLLESRK
ncbi:hypothetical protein TNCV_2085801 [Trichonephila clavipes]|nr:hypothetical protein TNCV_2085801 [Trichonephila clavipes]